MKYQDTPAFPIPTSPYDRVLCGGMTKREYFAAAALQGLLASTPEGETPDEKVIAAYALEYADALLKKLEKQS